MYVISFANPKGGTGKTTSTLLLAEQIAATGSNVSILDLDPNKNLLHWQESRQKGGKSIPFTVHKRPENDDGIIDQIDELEDSNDYLLIDLEGTASQAVTYALSRSDLVLIPLEPNSVEARHAARAVQLVAAAGKMLRKKINYRILFTRQNAAFATREEREVRSELTESSIPLLESGIVRRSPYTRMFGDSLLLSEMLELAEKVAEREQISKAIANARQYAQAAVTALEV